MAFKFKNRVQLITILGLILLISTSTLVYAVPPNKGAEPNLHINRSAVSFIDVSVNHWAYNVITDMTNLEALSGYPDGKFQPDRIVTRAEFAAVMVKAAGLEAQKVTKSSFADVKPADWYSPYIEAAKDYLTGYRNPKYFYNFYPHAPAQREDVIIAVVKLKGYDIGQAEQSTIKAMFTDFESITEAARNYVATAVENDLASGNPDGTFRPHQPITRAEAAALLWRSFVCGSDTKVAAPEQPGIPVIVPDDSDNSDSDLNSVPQPPSWADQGRLNIQEPIPALPQPQLPPQKPVNPIPTPIPPPEITQTIQDALVEADHIPPPAPDNG